MGTITIISRFTICFIWSSNSFFPRYSWKSTILQQLSWEVISFILPAYLSWFKETEYKKDYTVIMFDCKMSIKYTWFYKILLYLYLIIGNFWHKINNFTYKTGFCTLIAAKYGAVWTISFKNVYQQITTVKYLHYLWQLI